MTAGERKERKNIPQAQFADKHKSKVQLGPVRVSVRTPGMLLGWLLGQLFSEML